MIKKLVAWSVLAAASQLALADSAIAGAGASQKCGDWNAARSELDKSVKSSFIIGMTSSWLQGYLSGVNSAEAQTKKTWAFDIPSPAVLDGLLDKACKDDPLRQIFSAAVEISLVLRQRSPMPSK